MDGLTHSPLAQSRLTHVKLQALAAALVAQLVEIEEGDECTKPCSGKRGTAQAIQKVKLQVNERVLVVPVVPPRSAKIDLPKSSDPSTGDRAKSHPVYCGVPRAIFGRVCDAKVDWPTRASVRWPNSIKPLTGITNTLKVHLTCHVRTNGRVVAPQPTEIVGPEVRVHVQHHKRVARLAVEPVW